MIASNLYEEGTSIAEAIQVQLRKIGVDMEIELYESGARFGALRNGKYQMIELGGICATNDPSSWFLYYFHSQKQPAYCVYENKELDKLIDR